jgi:hypothetical protein
MTPSRQGALEVLLQIRQKVSDQIGDNKARELFTEELVSLVFREAWRYPMDDDRSAFVTRLREIVNDAIEACRINGAHR